MKHEFNTETPMLRLFCAVAAMCATLATGNFIDFIALRYHVVATALQDPVPTAERTV